MRCGVVDVGMTDNGSVSFDDNAVGNVQINLGKSESLGGNARPTIDLILAVPRPQKLERLLPEISCQGVRRIFLVDARKVEKDYFGEI